MSQEPVFADLRVDPAPRRPTSDGIDFTLICSATWTSHDAPVDFMIRHIDEQLLVITSLRIQATPDDPIGKKLLSTFPVGELLLFVREWIVKDGEPNGAMTRACLEQGSPLAELPGHDDWLMSRAQFIDLLRTSADGPRRGRRRKRDDDYLRHLAAEYVRIARTNQRNPRAELAALRHQSQSGIASDLRLAVDDGWLAKPASKGQRNEQHPGARLIAAWEQDGYPEWHPNHRPTKSKGKRG